MNSPILAVIRQFLDRKAALLISNVLTMLSYVAMFFAQNFEVLLTGQERWNKNVRKWREGLKKGGF